MSEIAVITGGTSGIGKATALCLREAGYTVYELSRREQGVEGLHHIRCDIPIHFPGDRHPLAVRSQPAFQSYFQQIWEVMQHET